ncbi:MAG TPA: hypothetical protein PLC79_08220 [Phycisphaerae bacterium]|nr:hypothetical protein [Phycisphaerae bacterium]
MNRREKILLYAVVGVLAFGIALRVIRSQVIDRLAAMDREIIAKKKKVADLNSQRFLTEIQKKQWAQISSETLATDAPTAYTKMINELDALARNHGLANWAERPSLANAGKSGVIPLIFSIQGEGTLSQLVSFLYDLQNLPFVTQTRSMKITPLSGKQKGTLQLSLKGETIVLPPHKLATSMPTADLQEGRRKEVQRTALASAKEYLSIAQKNLFEPYKAPPVVARAPDPPKPAPPPATQEAPKPAAGPPPAPRKFDPARSSTRITALLSTPDTQEVILTGGDKRRRAVKVGEEFDGGKLVYVHPDGAVVVYKEEGKKEIEKDFYPLGKLMSEMKVLTEEEHPEVFFIVSLMEKGDLSGLAHDKGSGS